MPEYSAFDLSEMRQRQMVDEAVQKNAQLNKGFEAIELKADKQHIHEALRHQHWHRTVRVSEIKT